ncbi:MAG: hypothetical protein J5379_00540 [Clostridiales bacterium]|nr:hypothetical protein [Clostridiales bacterium]
MREELMKTEVLAMYDVRGIQSYIFRTNRIKEIMGASNIVENIMTRGLEEIRKAKSWNPNKFIVEWNSPGTQDNIEFLSDSTVQMQVMYIGGGNAYVLFRSRELCSEVNRALAKYVFENTYSLQLAVAVVEMTNDYALDYNQVKLEMRRIKSEMPDGHPVGAFPFAKVDPMTGYPIVENDRNEGFLSQESKLKVDAYKKNTNEAEEKILDNLVTAKKDDSILAVVHIDGNNMGKKIGEIMRGISPADKGKYSAVTKVVRGISRSIDTSFKESFQAMTDFIDTSLAPKVKQKKPSKLYRKIICAGDDITFICNAKVALEAVKFFLEDVNKKHMSYTDMDGNVESIPEPFSACAGIAFFQSHFPFSDAYQVAEACCSSAKKIAKDNVRVGDNGEIGNYVDFQICRNISAADLKAYRKKQYTIPETDETIISRPYYVDDTANKTLNEKNQDRRINELIDCIRMFTVNIPRTQAKQLREESSKGEASRKAYITFLKSRKQTLPAPSTEGFWYDALELMDFYVAP